MRRTEGSADRAKHLFIVRLWQEPSDAQPPGQWRGLAQHVASGERTYFLRLADLNEFIRSQLAQPSSLPDEPEARAEGD